MFKPRYHPQRRKHYERAAWVAVGLVALASLIGFAGRLHWTMELFSHFRVQYVQVSLLLAGICLWVRMNKPAAAFIAILLFNYAFVYPLYLGKPEPKTTKPNRAMLMNLNAANGNTEQVLAAIEAVAPDLLLLEEVTPEWAAQLETLHETYPFRVAQPQPGCFGIMLLSKYPLDNGIVLEIGPAGVPSIIADVWLPTGVATLIGTHPPPPISKEMAALRNAQLAELPDIVANQKHPVLLMGDLNASPWSPYFRAMQKASGLDNSMKGFGFQPSWPSSLRLLQIPLDHLLHSPEITIQNRMIGSAVGSDHLPVVVDFAL